MRLNEIKIGGISVPSTAYWILPDGTQYDVEYFAHASGFLEWLLVNDKETYEKLKRKHKFIDPSHYTWESDIIGEAKSMGWVRFIISTHNGPRYPALASLEFHPSRLTAVAVRSIIKLLNSYRKIENLGMEINTDRKLYSFGDGMRRLRSLPVT